MLIFQYISLILYIIYIVLAIYASALIIYRKLDPVKSLSWIIVILLLPYIGLILYLFLGQNFRKKKIYDRKGAREERVKRIAANNQISELKNNPNLLTNDLKKYEKLIMLNLKSSKSLLAYDNSIDVYFSGREALDSMYEDISRAKQHIHLQSYIIEEDIIGKKFHKLLISKAKEGVEVRIMYDSVGCWGLSKQFISSLSQNGVEILEFAPAKFLTPTSKLNYRNHRKILVIDGVIGYIGGVNIADRYYNGGNFPEWRDTHIKIIGESVTALQSSFLLDRYFIINRQFGRKNKKYYPQPPLLEIDISSETKRISTQIITSGPDSDWASIMQCYFAAITMAKKRIFIVTPYFTPSESIINAMKISSLGGVEVSLMLSEKSDTNIAQWGSMSYATELLEAGVKVYLFRRGFNHSKVISIDSEFCIIGSANMDNRSLEHNFEITGIIYNPEIALKIENQFIIDIERCKSLASSKWAKRNVSNKIKEGFARLLSPLI